MINPRYVMPNEKTKQRKFILRLLHKYRLVILKESTFEEIGFVRLSWLNIISITGTLLILVIVLTYSFIAYTSIRERIPGYPDAEMRNNIVHNALRLDSLEIELKYRDQYFTNLSQIITGGEPNDFIDRGGDSGTFKPTILYTRSSADSFLRREAELSDKIGFSQNTENKEAVKLEKMHFFSPVRGLVTNSFDPLTNHFGADIVATPNAVVKAMLDGTVILATWTIETGNVIQIQHDMNLISIYKHNAELLKKIGMRVKAGDAIAIVGNSGELTTGPHLHLELWQNGVALNPEEYIVF